MIPAPPLQKVSEMHWILPAIFVVLLLAFLTRTVISHLERKKKEKSGH
jgi:hypothetical protein